VDEPVSAKSVEAEAEPVIAELGEVWETGTCVAGEPAIERRELLDDMKTGDLLDALYQRREE
jgi:hypothetical protein